MLAPMAEHPRPDPSPLEFADWRRRVAELYAEVRRQAAAAPEAAHTHWREARERLYREHPASPIPAEERGVFRASHFPYDRSLRFELPVAAAGPEGSNDPDPALVLPTSLPLATPFHRIGTVLVPFPGVARRLTLFWLDEYSGGLFLPFRDATNGRETYGAGRYLLDTAKGADLGPGRSPETLVFDFNFAFQPSCAFDPRWACPLAPPENRLDLEVAAGERLVPPA